MAVDFKVTFHGNINKALDKAHAITVEESKEIGIKIYNMLYPLATLLGVVIVLVFLACHLILKL